MEKSTPRLTVENQTPRIVLRKGDFGLTKKKRTIWIEIEKTDNLRQRENLILIKVEITLAIKVHFFHVFSDTVGSIIERSYLHSGNLCEGVKGWSNCQQKVVSSNPNLK